MLLKALIILLFGVTTLTTPSNFSHEKDPETTIDPVPLPAPLPFPMPFPCYNCR